jgi:4-deoxy-L-threo-5-hexosulose-uronate ketol-isomerase
LDTRHNVHYSQAKTLDTAGLRQHFLIDSLFFADRLQLTYSHIDRMIVAGAMPISGPIELGEELAKKFSVPSFLARRELGAINIGGPGVVLTSTDEWHVDPKEALYLGASTADVRFLSLDPTNPAKFYINCSPAHASKPSRKVTQAEAAPSSIGKAETSKRRTTSHLPRSPGLYGRR